MPNVGDVYRLSLVTASSKSEPIINTFYYRISVVGTGDEKATLATAFQTVCNTNLAATMPSSQTWVQIIVQNVKPVGPVEVFVPSNASGSVAGGSLPGQCAVIISRKTAQPGKGGRGRLFMGAIPLSLQSGADPGQVVITAYNTLITNLISTLTSGGWTFVPCLWKRRAQASYDLTNMTVNPMIKTRRSRAEGTRFHRRKKHTVGSI